MKIANNEYKETLNKTALSPKSKIVVDGKEYLGDVIKTPPKISHSNTSIVGGFPAKTLNVELYDFENNINLLNKEIIVYKGLLINGTIEYIKQGTFIAKADDISTNITDKTISISNAQDKVQLFEGVYVSELDWSNNQTHKGLEIVEEICNRLKMKLETKNFAFANYDFRQPNISSEITDRQIISSMACIGGEIAFLNANDNLAIKSQFITGDTISRKRYEKLSREKEVIINTVSIGNKDIDNDIIYPEKITGNRVELKIEDNPFVDLYKEEMIEEVAKHIIGVRYTPFVLDKIVDGYLYELNDVITVIDKNGEEFNAVILEIKDKTRIKSTIKNEVLESKQTDYKLAGSKKQDLAEVKFLVDHNNKLIKGLATEVTDTKEKIVGFEESLDGIKMSVDETNKKFDKEIVTKKSANGNPIEVDDAGEYPLESILIEGKSYQSTFPGEIKTVQGVTNHFLPIDSETKNDVSLTYNENDNSYNIVGTNSSSSQIVFIKDIPIDKTNLKDKTSYILSFNQAIDYNQIGIVSELYNGNSWLRSLVTSNTLIRISNLENATKFRCYIRVYANASVNIKNLKIQIEEGTQAHNIVPYGRWLEQIAIGDNLFNKANFTYLSGKDFDENGNIVDITDTAWRICQKYYPIAKGNHVISGKLVPKDWNMKIAFYNSRKEVIGLSVIQNTNNDVYKLNVPDNACFYRFKYRSTEFDLNTIQTEVGEEATSYKEYEENSALIDMNIYDDEGNIIDYHEVAEVNSTSDAFLDGSLIKKIGKYIITGDEAWVLSSQNFSISGTNYKRYDKGGKCICTHYPYGYPLDDHLWIGNSNFILIRDTRFTAVADFKAYLKEQYNQGTPVVVYYELENPQIYELEYERLQLYKGYNYITLNDELYPFMEIDYLTDSILNATYETKAEHRIENDKIISELNSKVTDNEFGEAITEINNTFEQKISDSEASTMNSVNAKFKDYSTTKEMDASIKSAVDENNAIIDLSVSQKIDDIQIGGTNLVLDSEKERTISKGGIETSNRIDVTPGEVLAISFDVKGASEYNGNIALIEQYVDDTTTTRHSYKWITGTVKTYYERIKYLYTVPKDVYSIDFGYRSYSVVNTFRKVKIERGNKFTDWDAAPEDKADDKEVKASLELKVGKNDNDQVVSMLNASAQEINLTSNRFSMKSDYSSINKNGIVDFKGGKVGGFNFDSQSISKDITLGGKTYRIYIQSYLENSKTDTWAFSTQISNDAGSFDGTAGIKYNGDIFCQNLDVSKNLNVANLLNNVEICNPYGNGDRITPVQYSSYKSGESTLASGTYNYIGGMTLGAGKYIAFVEVVFGSNKNGIRAINLSTTENYSTPQYTVPAVNGAATRFWYAVPLVLTKDTTYYINAYQNSGSNLSAWGNLYVFDIQSNV